MSQTYSEVMKLIDLHKIYNIAKDCPDYEQFEQLIKVELTGEPITVVIECEPVVINKNEFDNRNAHL